MEKPVLSAIVVTPGSSRQVLALLRSLRAQAMRARMEIVFVTTSLAELEPDEELLTAFSSWKAIELGPLVSMAASRAAGVRAASCPYIVFTEEHCFPEPGWAQAIVDAFEKQNADVVGPVIGNANPALGLSWANLCVEYGHWLAPHAGGLMDHLPGHNSAYHRDQLLALGEELEAGVESEFALHLRWRAQGRRLWLEPAARARHVNMTKMVAHLKAACAFQRPWAKSRAKDWGWPRRILYALSWPLIALVRLPRVIGNIQRSGQGAAILPRMLPAIALGLLASAFGEFLGYIGSVGDAQSVLMEVELYRERFLAADDTGGRALFL
jgi:Glycosyl transferase family 2